MRDDSIKAYDVRDRIASYEADMDVMHPRRHKMLAVTMEVLPFDRGESFVALDLGVGTGFYAKRLLEEFPNCRLIAIDGAPSMIEVATVRLGEAASRVNFRIGDFRDLDSLLKPEERGLVVISGYALHHLTAEEKKRVIRRCAEFLLPAGWFLNADLVVGDTENLENRFQQLRLDGILARADASDHRFCDAASARSFLDNLERNEGDQPLSLLEDLEILRAAGFEHSGAFWVEYREAVTGGIK
jgi:ubiquinone/menaquinone biosynthesis C-methylase UbiE